MGSSSISLGWSPLQPNLTAVLSLDYRVGSADGWSALYNFNATRNGTEWSPRFAIYGDLGVDNAQSLSKLQKEVQGGQYDAILHIGKQMQS